MLYLNRVPAPPLDTHISSIWYYESDPAPHALERVLPNGSAQLIINLKEDQIRSYQPELGLDRYTTTSGAAVSGVTSKFCVIDTAEQECAAGVSFNPGGTRGFFRPPADRICQADIPLDTLWNRSTAVELRERLLDAPSPQAKLDALEQLLQRMWSPLSVHSAVTFALKSFRHQPDQLSIATVNSQIGLSPKRFIEQFKTAVGITPKRYCRLLRFQRALSDAARRRGADWTQVAVDCGYYDQAHFIHDFRSFSGITPTEYQASRTSFQNHVKFLQSDSA